MRLLQFSSRFSPKFMKRLKILLQCCGAMLFCLTLSTQAQTPQWIWTSKTGSAGEERYFRKTFDFRDPVVTATLSASADARAEIFINGSKVATIEDWAKPVSVSVTSKIIQGENVIAAHCTGAEKRR